MTSRWHMRSAMNGLPNSSEITPAMSILQLMHGCRPTTTCLLLGPCTSSMMGLCWHFCWISLRFLNLTLVWHWQRPFRRCLRHLGFKNGYVHVLLLFFLTYHLYTPLTAHYSGQKKIYTKSRSLLSPIYSVRTPHRFCGLHKDSVRSPSGLGYSQNGCFTC
jgi:hypothetical protein